MLRTCSFRKFHFNDKSGKPNCSKYRASIGGGDLLQGGFRVEESSPSFTAVSEFCWAWSPLAVPVLRWGGKVLEIVLRRSSHTSFWISAAFCLRSLSSVSLCSVSRKLCSSVTIVSSGINVITSAVVKIQNHS